LKAFNFSSGCFNNHVYQVHVIFPVLKTLTKKRIALLEDILGGAPKPTILYLFEAA